MSRPMRWLRGILIALGVLVLLVLIAALWLVYTPSGARFAWARAQGAMGGKLSADSITGTLNGPLTVTNLGYRDADGEVAHIQRARLDIAPLALLAGRLHVQDASVSGIVVTLYKQPEDKTQPAGTFSLQPPLTIDLDHVALQDLRIVQDGKPLFVANSLTLAGQWSDRGLTVKSLALRSPSGQVDLAGTLGLQPGYSGQGHARFDWTAGGKHIAGELRAHSDGEITHVNIRLTRPTPVTLTAQVRQSEAMDWTLALAIPSFDPKPLLGSSVPAPLALALQGHGDRHSGEVTGHVDAGGHRVKLDPLRFALRDNDSTLVLQKLHLSSPQAKGSLDLSGPIHLKAQPIDADLTAQWQDVVLPADLVGQSLATHGKLHVSGSAEQFAAQGRLAAGPPGQLSDIALDLNGTPRRIALTTLKLVQANGGLDVHGNVDLQPKLAWQLDAKAHKFDPGALLAGWNGALDFDLHSDGKLTDAGPRGSLTLEQLDGTLRKRAVSGHADLKLTGNESVQGSLELNSGNSQVQVTGHGGNATDAEVKLRIASLGDWLPQAAGSVEGHFDIKGRWPKLAVNGQLDAQNLIYSGQRADVVKLTASIDDISHPGGRLTVNASKLDVAGLSFATLNIRGQGNAAQHRLDLAARGDQLDLDVALSGQWRKDAWNGTLSTLKLEPQGIPPWRLRQNAALSWNAGALHVSELCLTAGEPLLCAAADTRKDGSLAARYRIKSLPLQLVTTLAAPAARFRVTGTIGGDGQIMRDANGALSGHATLNSDSGQVEYPDSANKPLLSWNNLDVNVDLDGARKHATLDVQLAGGGRIQGDATVSGAQQALSGQVRMQLRDLGFVELLTPQLAAVDGKVDGAVTLKGTLDKPVAQGEIDLTDFKTEVPLAGLKLHDGHVRVSTGDGRALSVDGAIASGEGTLALKGKLSLDPQAPLDLTVTGNKFTAADIPSAKVVVAPDLHLISKNGGYDLTGKLEVTRADVALDKLPGGAGGGASVSPDVVIVDAENPAVENKPLPISANVQVMLGEHVAVTGFGLDGKISGGLRVVQVAGRAATGQGQIQVSGTFKAYGQDLTIKRGRLLFAHTPLDNPGLDIRATREIQNESVTAGLLIRGTAKKPVLTVFSDPAMDESEALAYLVTGHSLSQVKSGEGDALGSAAQALGTAGGDLLAKRIGARLGVDEIGVSNNQTLGGSAFTVGKYLSPRLYLGYGVGLFTPGEVITLRYKLSSRWEFEAQNATNANRAGFNYRYEH